MTLARIHTRAALGIEAPYVTVEAHISAGLPALTIVGLPETTVKEARDRVRSAIINSGYTFPARKITINLAPADLPKEGGRYDLPIAIALLAASQQLSATALSQYEFIGELALTGALRGVPGAISSAIQANNARRQIIVPQDNEDEAGLLEGADCYIAATLLEVCAILEGKQTPTRPRPPAPASSSNHTADLQDVIGQEQGKRALEIGAAGGHNLLLIGPPGTGKTMLATRLIGLLPPLTLSEALESAAIRSMVDNRSLTDSWRQRPFRSPHHSASINAMVGGGRIPAPGEISLANNGVLFLDELPHFDRRALDALREPIETGEIHISRTRAKIRYPARFQLIAAMNPSPAGHYQGEHNRSSPEQTLRYLSRLSGPFLDRFDITLEIPLLASGMISQPPAGGESSTTVRKRVIAARQRQEIRQHKLNALLTGPEVKAVCMLEQADAIWLEEAITQLGLSIRAWQRVLKVARTIADLASEEQLSRQHLQEALSYRAMDRLLIHLQQQLA
ncbi:YifB family Mg chelatase-like AAA ATPase [Shimwellia pseudoproteus]|uniref:YifB family Mg chelatase-like AAA ATPase n=1 Tax=Shimwellia pseudoproteus TaxID=570012 RepID=UPI0018EB930E|nr:YifB family Mg chelatase-like AAA ATPase [Shimwellia pseudoproteus]MBJ3816264.1 YifB family Mg chelatase-like AAA ATPase [Shimwellia pseudoproteus]